MPKEDTQWKPGQSGNPKGKPKGSLSLVTILKRKLQEIDPEWDKETAEVLIEQYIKDALEKGDGQAIRDMMDRTDGKPTNKHEVEGNFTVIFDKEDEEL